jgi:hypothetical protein
MKLSPSWEAMSCAATKNLSSILWKPKIYYRISKSLPLVPNLGQTNPVHAILYYLSNIHLNIIESPIAWYS